MNQERFSGVLAPVVTPFDANLNPDPKRFIAHCQWLLARQVGLAVFGTNSEANSLSVEEKIDLLGQLTAAGADPERLMPGTGSCSLTDAVRLSTAAVSLGCRGVLMLPPFYYKNVSDQGLYRFYSEVLERVGDARLQVYLYHIPPVTQVPLSLGLIDELLKHYPKSIAGIKDSSGEWQNTLSLLEAGFDDFRVFCGSESFLLATLQHGGAGCISATANVNPAAIHSLFTRFADADAEQRQAQLNQLRLVYQSLPMIPALKSTLALFRKDANWDRVRPPLMPLTAEQKSSLDSQLAGLNFQL